VQEIERVHARVHPLVLELTGKKTPRDGLQAKFSVYHGGAIGLVLGKAGPAQYEDVVVLSDEIVSVRDRIEAEADKGLAADETYITLTLRDGRKIEKHVKHALGSLEVPMTDEQLEEKFVDQCALVLGEEGTKRASERCWGLESSKDVGEIVRSI